MVRKGIYITFAILNSVYLNLMNVLFMVLCFILFFGTGGDKLPYVQIDVKCF